MSIKLTWKDNATTETQYEVYQIDPNTNDKVLVASLPGTTTTGDTMTWLGTGEYACGDHTFDVAAVTPAGQRVYLPEPITITLPCDNNIVVCHRFETNAGNSAPAQATITGVYNVNEFVTDVPSIKTDLTHSARFRGDSVIEYAFSGTNNFSRLNFKKRNNETYRNFTVEGWFKFDPFSTTDNENGSILYTGSRANEGTDNPSIQGGVYHTPAEADGDKVAKIFFKTKAGPGAGSLYEYVTTPAIKADTWTHIAWVKRDAQLQVFVDGELHQQFAFKGLNVSSTGTNNGMRIGSGTTRYVTQNPGMLFKGYMADFRIINGQAITICPDVFPASLCETGINPDESIIVDDETLRLDACVGVDVSAKQWTDNTGSNSFTFNNTSSVEYFPDACPCYVKVKSPLTGPNTSTFRSIETFSFSTWFRTTKDIKDGATSRTLLDYTNTSGSAKYGFQIGFSTQGTGTLDVVIGTGLNQTWEVYSSKQNEWLADRWYHVTVINMGAMIGIYVDRAVDNIIGSVVGINSHNNPPKIGTGAWGGTLDLAVVEFKKNEIIDVDAIQQSFEPTIEDTLKCVDTDCDPELGFGSFTDSPRLIQAAGSSLPLSEFKTTEQLTDIVVASDRITVPMTSGNDLDFLYIQPSETIDLETNNNELCASSTITVAASGFCEVGIGIIQDTNIYNYSTGFVTITGDNTFTLDKQPLQPESFTKIYGPGPTHPKFDQGSKFNVAVYTSVNVDPDTYFTAPGFPEVVFDATGGDQFFTVPAGVTKIAAHVWGAGGSSVKKWGGGAGGYTRGLFDVTEGETLLIGVGETSFSMTPGYSPGGQGGNGTMSPGHSTSWAGGGMSGIFRDGAATATNAVLIAGGGGAASGGVCKDNSGGGGGGGLSGGNGSRYDNDQTGGTGGTQTNAGINRGDLCTTAGLTKAGRFRGADANNYGHSTGGAGGAGWFGGGQGCPAQSWDYNGGGGSGYIASDVESGKTVTGDPGRANVQQPEPFDAPGRDDKGNSATHGRIILKPLGPPTGEVIINDIELCVAPTLKQCLPPREEPVDVSCDHVKLHLSDVGQDNSLIPELDDRTTNGATGLNFITKTSQDQVTFPHGEYVFARTRIGQGKYGWIVNVSGGSPGSTDTDLILGASSGNPDSFEAELRGFLLPLGITPPSDGSAKFAIGVDLYNNKLSAYYHDSTWKFLGIVDIPYSPSGYYPIMGKVFNGSGAFTGSFDFTSDLPGGYTKINDGATSVQDKSVNSHDVNGTYTRKWLDGRETFAFSQAEIPLSTDFQMSDGVEMCVEGYMYVESNSGMTYTVNKTESNWEVTANTSTYNGNDWYIATNSNTSSDTHYVEFARESTKHQVPITPDQWFHFACVFTGQVIKIYIDGIDIVPTVLTDISQPPIVDKLTIDGVISQFRITQGNMVYVNKFYPPLQFTPDCTGEKPLTTCVKVTNDQTFNTWEMQSNGSHDAYRLIEHAGYQSLELTTFSGDISYVGAVRSDVVVFDYPLAEASAFEIKLTHQYNRVDNSSGSDLMLIIKQNTTWFYYHVSDLHVTQDKYTKTYSIDLTNWTGWGGYIRKVGLDDIDLSGSTTTTFGIAVQDTSAGVVRIEIHDVEISLKGVTCDSVMTPDFPSCEDVSLHVTTNTANTSLPPNTVTEIDDYSSLMQTVTSSKVTRSSTTSAFDITTQSIEFSGSGANIRVVDPENFEITEKPFTVEFWANTNSTNDQYLFSLSDGNSGDSFNMKLSGGVLIAKIGSKQYTTTYQPAIDQWHHYAMVGDGDNVKIFTDGIQQLDDSYNISLTAPGDFYIGSTSIGDQPASFDNFSGYMEDFIVAVDHTTYTTTFQPPSAATVHLSDVKQPAPCENMQIQLRSTNRPDGDVYIFDSAGGNAVENINKAVVHKSDTFYGESSLYFSSSNTSLQVGLTDIHDFVNDFTVATFLSRQSGTNQTITTSKGDRVYGIVGRFTDEAESGWLLFITRTGSPGFMVNIDGQQVYLIDRTATIDVDSWSSVVVTRTNNILRLYVNGRAVDSADCTGVVTGPNVLHVGKYRPASNFGSYKGYINDLMIFNNWSMLTTCAGDYRPDTWSGWVECSDFVEPLEPACEHVLAHIQPGTLDINDTLVNFTKAATDPEFTSGKMETITDLTHPTYKIQDTDTTPLFVPIDDVIIDDFTFEILFRLNSLADDATLLWSGDENVTDFELLITTTGQLKLILNDVTVTSVDLSLSTGVHNISVSRYGTGTNQAEIFVDGVSVSSFTSADTINFSQLANKSGVYVGSKYVTSGIDITTHMNVGYMRICKDIAVYNGQYTPESQLTPKRVIADFPLMEQIKLFLLSNGTDGSTDMYDISKSKHLIVSEDNKVKFTTAVKKFGNSSIQFPGDATLKIPRVNDVTSDIFNIRYTDFTYEMWVHPTVIDTKQVILSLDSTESDSGEYGSDAINIQITDDNAVQVQIRSHFDGNPSDSSQKTTGVGVMKTKPGVIDTANTWYHIAWSREDGVFRVYVNGIDQSTPQSQLSTGSSPIWPWAPMDDDTNGEELTLLIGGDGENYFTGYIDGFQFIKDNAVYTDCSYVVPDGSSPLDMYLPDHPDCNETKLHLQSDFIKGVQDFSFNENEIELHDTVQSADYKLFTGANSIATKFLEVTNTTNPGTLRVISNTPTTVESWVHFGGSSTNRVILLTSTYNLKIHDGRLHLAILMARFNHRVFNSFPVNLPSIDDWNHYAITHDPQLNRIKLYINGALVRNIMPTGGFSFIPGTVDYLSVGGISNSVVTYFDDVRVSNKIVYVGNTLLPTERITQCNATPGQCINITPDYSALRLCMSFEDGNNNDMSRYSHPVKSLINDAYNTTTGVVNDATYQTHVVDGEVVPFHAGFHGTRYHDLSQSGGLSVDAHVDLNPLSKDFSIELHTQPKIVMNVNSTYVLYEHTGTTGDFLRVSFKSNATGDVTLCCELKSGGENIVLETKPVDLPGGLDFGDESRGAANQKIKVQRQRGLVALYGYYNRDDDRGRTLLTSLFDHSLNLDQPIRLGVDQSGNVSDVILDSIQYTVDGVIGDCVYQEKKPCMTCSESGDVDYVRYICSVVRSTGTPLSEISCDLRDQIEYLFTTAKNQGWWSKINALYLPIWSDPIANAINLKSPGQYNLNDDWSFNTSNGEWVHDSGPYIQLNNYDSTQAGNGIVTPFLDTDFSNWSSSSISMGVYLRDLPRDTNAVVMSTDNVNGLRVDNTTGRNDYTGFILQNNNKQYINGSHFKDINAVYDLTQSNGWVVGGTNWAGGGSMVDGVNNLKIQAIHFGSGLTEHEIAEFSMCLTRIVQTIDITDSNPTHMIHDDYYINKGLYAVATRNGFSYNNPSWVRDSAAESAIHPDNMNLHECYEPLVNFYTQATTHDIPWLDKIKALYLPMWKHSNINRINFACPGVYDIEQWNHQPPGFAQFGNSNPFPFIDRLIDPASYFSADDIVDLESGEIITMWEDTGRVGKDIVMDSSQHDDLSTEPAGPQYLTTGGINRNEKCVLFGYNGSYQSAETCTIDSSRVGNSYRGIYNTGLGVDGSSVRHIFIVYRNISAVNGSYIVSFDNVTETGIKQSDWTDGESIQHVGFGRSTVNGYRGSYYKNQPTGNLTWTPDPISIWPDGSNNTPAGTVLLPETRHGKRIVHIDTHAVGDAPDDMFICLGDMMNDGKSAHCEYYDVVVYDRDLHESEHEIIYNVLAAKHDITLEKNYTHAYSSAYVTHGHGNYAYISHNQGQGTVIPFEQGDSAELYSNKNIWTTESGSLTGGFGVVKHSRQRDCDFDPSTGVDAALGHGESPAGLDQFHSLMLPHVNHWNPALDIDQKFRISNTGFLYTSRVGDVVDLFTTNHITPIATKIDSISSFPLSNPMIFTTNKDYTSGAIDPDVKTNRDRYQAFFWTDNLTQSNTLSSFAQALNDVTYHVTPGEVTVCDRVYSTDPDVHNYICAVVNAGGVPAEEAANDSRTAAIEQFVTTGKSKNWYSTLAVVYLPVWQCETANKINLINPGERALVLNSDRFDHESGNYLRFLGGGSTQTSNDIVVPVTPRDIIEHACDDFDANFDYGTYNYNVTTHLPNFNTSSSVNETMWSFNLNSLTDETKTFANDPYEQDVDEQDLHALHWPDFSTSFELTPSNTSINGPVQTFDHGLNISGGLLSTDFNYTRKSRITFHDVTQVSNTFDMKGWKDTGGTGRRDYRVPEYYLNMPLGQGNNTCVDYISVGKSLSNQLDDYNTAVETLLYSMDNSLNGHTSTPLGSDDIRLQSATSDQHGRVHVLASVKNITESHGISVPEVPSTTVTPLTSVWDDDRLWNFKLHDYEIEIDDPSYTQYSGNDIRPSYDFRSNNAGAGEGVGVAFGYAIRRPQGGLDGTEYLNGNNYWDNRNAESQPYIRGLTSGAVRRSCWGYLNSPHNDNPTSGSHEDRLLKFKIIPDQPEKGLFVGGGSSRTHDTTTYGTSPDHVVQNNADWGYDASGKFDLYPSNNTPFIVGEPVEIMYVDRSWTALPYKSMITSHGLDLESNLFGLPMRHNLESYNGRYRVAEYVNLDSNSLTDGDVFTSGTTRGGEQTLPGDGSSVPLKAWMRIDMQPIETINLGATGNHDLLLTSSLTATEPGVNHLWVERYQIDIPENHNCSINTNLAGDIVISGTFKDYAVVNYDVDSVPHYSINVSCEGDAQTQISPNPEKYTQTFVGKISKDTGKFQSFIHTKGKGWSTGDGSAIDSQGNMYVVGGVSGDVTFESANGLMRGVDRGVNTGSKHNMFGYVAKLTMDDTQVSRHVKYRPLDYTWDWINYIDATTTTLSGERRVFDVAIDDTDNIYITGYYDCPTEIGRSGATEWTNDDLKFEPGYMWDNTDQPTLFVSKYTPTGKCIWSTTSRIDSRINDIQKLQIGNNKLYVMSNVNGSSFGTQSLSGVCVDSFDLDTGEYQNSKNINATTVNATDFKVTDRQMLVITGTFTGDITSSNLTLVTKPSSQSTTSGFYALLPDHMTTGRVGVINNDQISNVLSVLDYTNGNNMIISSGTNNFTTNLGTGSLNINKPVNLTSYMFTFSHELQ